MTGITENGINCTQGTRDIIRDHQDLISISLSRIEREFTLDGKDIPDALREYISDVDDFQNQLAKQHVGIL